MSTQIQFDRIETNGDEMYADRIGRLVGILELQTQSWSLGVYLGERRVFIVHGIERKCKVDDDVKKCECERNESIKSAFAQAKLTSAEQLTHSTLVDTLIAHDPAAVKHFDQLKPDEYELWWYKINLTEMDKQFNITPEQFFDNLCDILHEMHYFDNGDIVSFDRQLYHHHAIVTDASRMIITQLNGELSKVVQGNLETPGQVGQAHLIENACVFKSTDPQSWRVGGFLSPLRNANSDYDKIHTPLPSEEIVNRAVSKLGNDRYHMLEYNCQHFASYCRNGEHFSPDVTKMGQKINEAKDQLLANAKDLAAYISTDFKPAQTY